MWTRCDRQGGACQSPLYQSSLSNPLFQDGSTNICFLNTSFHLPGELPSFPEASDSLLPSPESRGTGYLILPCSSDVSCLCEILPQFSPANLLYVIWILLDKPEELRRVEGKLFFPPHQNQYRICCSKLNNITLIINTISLIILMILS